MQELGLAHVFVNRYFNDFHQAALKKYGLTNIEWLILGATNDASKDGGVRVTDLASTFSVKSTYITAMLNILRAKGYVETRFDASDARVRLAYITPKGEKEIAVVERYMHKEVASLFSDAVTADEFAAYAKVVQKISRFL